jgi:hypothetical protein
MVAGVAIGGGVEFVLSVLNKSRQVYLELCLPSHVLNRREAGKMGAFILDVEVD